MKKYMKKILSFLLVLALFTSVTACSQSNVQEDIHSESGNAGEMLSDDTSALSHYPITVTDQAGREVTIEKQPEKLVSGYYISTSLLIALDLEEKLVGIEAKADKREIYHLSSPELIELPNVGTAKEFDLEGCAALEPDLVILPLKLKSAVETLESLGIDVLLVNPESQELLTEMIHLVASATDTEERAQELISFTDTQEDFLATALEETEAPNVYLAGNSSMLSTAGKGMYQADMIRMAGGKNVANEIEDTYWVEIDYEQLLAWNPDYIILASDAEYTVEDVLTDPNLTDCTAVVNGDVYQLPSKAEAWDSPVPSGILGSIWLANVLHADNVSEAECVARINEYYETFYNFTYSEN